MPPFKVTVNRDGKDVEVEVIETSEHSEVVKTESNKARGEGAVGARNEEKKKLDDAQAEITRLKPFEDQVKTLSEENTTVKSENEVLKRSDSIFRLLDGQVSRQVLETLLDGKVCKDADLSNEEGQTKFVETFKSTYAPLFAKEDGEVKPPTTITGKPKGGTGGSNSDGSQIKDMLDLKGKSKDEINTYLDNQLKG